MQRKSLSICGLRISDFVSIRGRAAPQTTDNKAESASQLSCRLVVVHDFVVNRLRWL